jgi:hypothetical protein
VIALALLGVGAAAAGMIVGGWLVYRVMNDIKRRR